MELQKQKIVELSYDRLENLLKSRRVISQEAKIEDIKLGFNHIEFKIVGDGWITFKENEPVTEIKKEFKPKIICLCGSTKFYKEFQRANYEETMVGNIILSVGFYPHSSQEAHGETIGITPEQKLELDELHKRKIDLADEIYVLNIDGYIGESTRSEIEYAKKAKKLIRYKEPINSEYEKRHSARKDIRDILFSGDSPATEQEINDIRKELGEDKETKKENVNPIKIGDKVRLNENFSSAYTTHLKGEILTVKDVLLNNTLEFLCCPNCYIHYRKVTKIDPSKMPYPQCPACGGKTEMAPYCSACDEFWSE